jgi:8-oxo-dGTP pyrophosphatase MutT (NUDIX family)
MYTIYVNGSPLRLRSEAIEPRPELTLRYPGKKQFFLQLTDTLESGSYDDGAVVICPDVEEAWEAFKGLHKWIPAAGGAVWNDGKLLCIHRRGSWDLPKGKIDKGETIPEAAVREVQEETGINQIDLGAALPTTYHTYRTKKGKRVLKPTYWFHMETNDAELVPQAEEDIEKAEWIGLDGLAEIKAGMYKSLHHVVDAAVETKN